MSGQDPNYKGLQRLKLLPRPQDSAEIGYSKRQAYKRPNLVAQTNQEQETQQHLC